ncbi:MAG: DNA phosphorothioation-associated protein 4 [Nibricoccus sp.]
MRRIQRDGSHEELIKSLTSGDQPLFKEIWRVLLFASAVGISHGKRKPLKNVESGKSMPDTYFTTPSWPGYLHLIGITETGNSDILRFDEANQERVLTSFEEHANAGLEIIQEKILASATPLDAIILLMAESEEKQPQGANVAELI